MKGNRDQKRRGRPKRGPSIKDDPFFSSFETNKKRKKDSFYDGDDIVSDDDEEEENGVLSSEEEKKKEEEDEKETADEKRQRLAKAYLDKVQGIAGRKREDGSEEEEEKEEEEDEEERDRGFEKEGERDSFVKNKLIKEQLEESGRLRRAIASRIQKPESSSGFRVLVKHRHSVTAVCLCDDGSRGFSASKDGTIVHWDVDSGKGQKYQWPNEEVLRFHGAKDPEG